MVSNLPSSPHWLAHRLATYLRVFDLLALSDRPSGGDKQYYILVLSQGLMEAGPESGGKQRTSVGSDSLGYPMPTDDSGYIQLCQFICSVSGADRDEMSNLC